MTEVERLRDEVVQVGVELQMSGQDSMVSAIVRTLAVLKRAYKGGKGSKAARAEAKRMADKLAKVATGATAAGIAGASPVILWKQAERQTEKNRRVAQALLDKAKALLAKLGM